MGYPVYTVTGAEVTPGAKVDLVHLPGAKVTIPAVTVGEAGRGRHLGVLPVTGAGQVPCPDRGTAQPRTVTQCRLCGSPTQPATRTYLGCDVPVQVHPDTGLVPGGHITAARVARTRSGRPKLLAEAAVTDTRAVIVVCRTPIGGRGGNAHTGDSTGWQCAACHAHGLGPMPVTCPSCGQDTLRGVYLPRPGHVLAQGRIAQGDAGRAGSGEQMIVLLPRGQVLRVAWWADARYAIPVQEAYLHWDGEAVYAASLAERQLSELY